jgi:hypothetical protein
MTPPLPELLFDIVCLLAGFLLGWVVWGGRK